MNGNMHSRPGRVSLIVALAALLTLPAGLPLATAQQPQDQDDEALQHANALSRVFRRAAESAVPTVVMIKTATRPQPQASRNGAPTPRRENPFRGTPFEDFFSDDFDQLFRQPIPRPRAGVGSGVIIDPDGIILTNNHVVDGADEITVELSDGREFKATDVKTDPQTDLAVLRIEGADSLPAARLGDSDELEIGDWVIAIGNPFELELTVSAGIISGKGRVLGQIERAKFLQTDAAINPGNSGGPLVNLSGEVVGINTAIASSSGGYQGVGFAIPINLAKWVTSQLIERGAVQRAYLGVKIGEITPQLAEQFGVQRNAGVLVGEVMPDTPAARAGFREGDVITKFAGQQVNSPRDLQGIVEQMPLGEKQQVVVLRDGREQSLDVVLEAMPQEFAQAERLPRSRQDEQQEGYTNEALGLQVSDLTEEQAAQLNYSGYEGVVVTRVLPDSVAFEQGLREGMLIRRVGRDLVTVKNVDEFAAAVESASLEEGIMLLVRDPRGNQFFVVLKQS